MQEPSSAELIVPPSPFVSIVLPLYNSEKELPNSLTELDGQNYPDREIILVDDGSIDGTLEVATKLSAGRPDIQVVRAEHGGPSHARNVGASKARGDVIFFAESDCTYEKSFVQRAVRTLESEPGAGAVCLTGAPLITRSTLATRCIEVENKMQHKLLNQGKIKPFYAWVYRKNVFTQLGGFDESLFQGEDKDLFSRLKAENQAVAWVPGVNWRHIRNQSTLDMAEKWITRGRSRILYSIKHREPIEILKAIAPFWVTVAGLFLLTWSIWVGVAVLVLVAAAFLAQSARVTSISWSEVEDKRVYFGYPLFNIVRNFSLAVGYSIALVKVGILKARGKYLIWNKV